jgi:nitrite reductase/ring-hydroxylating ferredoxin subunit
MHAVAERRTPQSVQRLPVALRRHTAYLRAALRQVSRRLAGRTPGFQPDTASTPASSRVLCRLRDVPDGGVIGVDPAYPLGVPLVLRRQGNSVQAWLNICPQGGRRMDWAPGLFHVKDGTLRCAVRGAQFALDGGGICTSGPCRGSSLIPVPVRVQGGLVTIQ